MPRKRVTTTEIKNDRLEVLEIASTNTPTRVGVATVELPSEKITLHRMLKQLRLDHEEAARTLGAAEARYLVDLYYQMQDFRKTAANRRRAGSASASAQARMSEERGEKADRTADVEIVEEAPAAEPNQIMEWVALEFQAIENHVKRLMGAYAQTTVPGRWAMSLVGIGPVLAGGLVAHIDVEKARSVGGLWRFAGMDPTVHWHGRNKAERLVNQTLPKGFRTRDALTEEQVRICAARWNLNQETVLRFASTNVHGEPCKITKATLTAALARRPFNDKLKVLCWKVADCAKKFSGREDCFYGQLYRDRKRRLMEQNEHGQFADAAAEVLEHQPDHAQAAVYREGKLPPGHLDARAMRWVAKMFLSHYYEVAYQARYGVPTRTPYALTLPTHSHRIMVPNDPFGG